MHTVDSQEAQKLFNSMFNESKSLMRKVEVLQDYTAVDGGSSLQAWLAGNHNESIRLGESEDAIIGWRQKALQANARIQRIHTVLQPYTPYLEWEIEVVYKNSLLKYAAEDVKLVNLDQVSVTLPLGDFWIFDNTKALEFIYSQKGDVTGAHISTGNEVDKYIQVWKHLEKLAYVV